MLAKPGEGRVTAQLLSLQTQSHLRHGGQFGFAQDLLLDKSAQGLLCAGYCRFRVQEHI